MASSELVFSPEIDRNALKRTEKQLEESLAIAGKKAGIWMQRDIKTGITKGIKGGVDDGIKGSKGKFTALGLGVAMAAGAIIANTMDKTLGSLEDNIDRILGKLDTMKEISSDAAAFGFGKAEYAALNIMGAAQGMDASDISGIMTGFIASLKDEEMSGFKGIRESQGIEKAFFDFLSSTGKLSESDRQQQLISVFGEDDMRLVSKFLNPMMQLENQGKQLDLNSLYSAMTGGAQLNLAALQGGMDRTALASQAYNRQNATTLANQLSSGVTVGQVGAVGAYNASNRNLEAAQMSALNLQIKAKIVADSMTVAQIKAGIVTGDAVFSYAEDTSSRISQLTSDPSLDTLNKLSKSPEMDKLAQTVTNSSNPVFAGIEAMSSNILKLVELTEDLLSNSKEQKEEFKGATYRGY